MRIIYTMLFLCISFSSVSQALPKSGDKDSSYLFKTVCLPVKSATDVLYVIDGVPADESALKNLNPSLIDSIFILKDTVLNFYCRPPKPVILIYTHRSSNLQITIRDKEGQFVLPGATVSFISSDKKDTLMYVADSAGQVSRKDLKKGVSYNLCITATGYKAYTGSLKAIQNGEILMERDFVLCPEVIVSTAGHTISCHRNYISQHQVTDGCGMQTQLIREQASGKAISQPEQKELSLYPNPVQRGQSVTVKLLQGYFPTGTIRVLSLDGKLVATLPVNGERKQGLLYLPIPQSRASGVYILQLVYANGRVGASEKIIIQ